jgi:hypothetical protein
MMKNERDGDITETQAKLLAAFALQFIKMHMTFIMIQPVDE